MSNNQTRKLLFLLFLNISVSLEALAQARHWSVSMKGGPTVATFVGGDVSDIKGGIGWGACIEGEYPLTNTVSMSFGIAYTRNRFSSSDSISFGSIGSDRDGKLYDARFMQEHIQLPILLNVHVGRHLALKAGLQPRLLLSATMDCRVSGSYADVYAESLKRNLFAIEELPRIPFEYDQRTQVRNAFDKIGIAIPFGLSYDWSNIVIDGRGSYSLSPETGSYGNMLFLVLSLGYKFHL